MTVMKTHPFPRVALAGVVFLGLPACASDPDAPEIDRPAAAGIVSGEVTSTRQYLDRVEEANKRNAEKARRKDWTYARPAVGERE